MRLKVLKFHPYLKLIKKVILVLPIYSGFFTSKIVVTVFDSLEHRKFLRLASRYSLLAAGFTLL
jgi:hypothetical protein